MSKTEEIAVNLGDSTLTITLDEGGGFECSPEWLLSIFEHLPEAKNPNYQEGQVSLYMTRDDIYNVFNVKELSK